LIIIEINKEGIEGGFCKIINFNLGILHKIQNNEID